MCAVPIMVPVAAGSLFIGKRNDSDGDDDVDGNDS